MGDKWPRGLFRLFILAALAAGAVFFAPVQLGGSTLFSATVGNSMEPLFHKGDLAVVRRASSYEVGDIVLYQSPTIHRPVLHRIIVIQNDHYFFKGDNNHFVDPGYATSSDLLGKLWFHIPKAGKILSWFGAPLHTAFLAGIAGGLLLLGGGRGKKRRRGQKRDRGSLPTVKLSAPRRFIHRPRKSAENITSLAALSLALVLMIAGFGASLSRTIPVSGYRQTGTFSYVAKTARPDATYPTGFARSGQPLFLSSFKDITIKFAYRFISTLPHHVHGTVSLKALIASDTSWRNLYTLEKTTRFTGDSVKVGGAFDLKQLQTLLTQISLETSSAGSEYTIDLQPVVHIVGTVNGKAVNATFSPVLPFTATPSLLKLNIAQTVAPPGATYAAPSAASTLAAGLNPQQTGRIPGLAPNYLSFARYHFAVSAVRGVGLGLAGLALFVFLSKLLFRRKREVWSVERRIANRYGCVLVDVVSFTDESASSSRSAQVPTFEALATLAQYSERPILRETRGPIPAYAVEDDGRLYVYRPDSLSPVSLLAAEAS
jgi:signal peptidase I